MSTPQDTDSKEREDTGEESESSKPERYDVCKPGSTSPPKSGERDLPAKREDNGGPLTVRDVQDQALEDCGITRGELGAKVVQTGLDQLEATKTKVVVHEGEVKAFVDMEDNAARLGAARLLGEIAPVFSSRSEGEGNKQAVQVNVILPPWGGGSKDK